MPQGAFKYDVFASHAKPDKPIVNRFVDQWKDLGLKCFYDAEAISAGSMISPAIQEGLRASRYIVAFLTRSSLRHHWVDMEATGALGMEQPNGQPRLVPVVLESIEFDNLPIWARNRAIVELDVSDSDQRNRNYHHLLRTLGVGDPLPDCPPVPLSAVEATVEEEPLVGVTAEPAGGGIVTAVARKLWEFTAAGSLAEFDESKLDEIVEFMKSKGVTDIELKFKREGSVKLTFSVPAEAIEKLKALVDSEEARALGILSGREISERELEAYRAQAERSTSAAPSAESPSVRVPPTGASTAGRSMIVTSRTGTASSGSSESLGASGKVTVQDLVQAGVHFGCRASRWNPKMAPYIHGRRNQIHVIDLRETMKGIIRAQNLLYHVASEGRSILWVGTKRQVKGVIQDAGARTGMPIVTERWIGGTLTNFSVIRSRLKRLEELEKISEGGVVERLTKKELARLRREHRKIERNLGGIRDMTSMPGTLVVVDPSREYNAIREARRMGIAIVGLLDTDCDPEMVDIVIPGNDDALKSVRLLVDQLITSVEEGAASHREEMATTQPARSFEDFAEDEPRPTRGRREPPRAARGRTAGARRVESGEPRAARAEGAPAEAHYPAEAAPAEEPAPESSASFHEDEGRHR